MNQLELSVRQFVESLNLKKPLSELPIKDARNFLELIQSTSIKKKEVEIKDFIIEDGKIKIRLIRPISCDQEILPMIVYAHGGGWILGSKNTHDRLIREIVSGTKSALIFVDYDRSPEETYPTAIIQTYVAMKYFVDQAFNYKLDTNRLVIMGDSVGGNIATVVTMLANQFGYPKIHYQALFYPVTDSQMDTNSYYKFKDGPWLTKESMEWFWNAYAPDKSIRQNFTLSPLRAPKNILAKLPPTLIITDENDVLRDEGELYAHRLMEARVDVFAIRIVGTMHDFLMINEISNSLPTKEAMNIIIDTLNKVFWSID